MACKVPDLGVDGDWEGALACKRLCISGRGFSTGQRKGLDQVFGQRKVLDLVEGALVSVRSLTRCMVSIGSLTKKGGTGQQGAVCP